MSAYHRILLEEFSQHGGTLTPAQLAAATGPLWPRDIQSMRRAGYLIVEDAAGLFHLDLEDVPALDVGGAGGDALAGGVRSEGGSPDAVASSPDTDPDPQVDGETQPLFEAPAKAASPYDPSVEAA